MNRTLIRRFAGSCLTAMLLAAGLTASPAAAIGGFGDVQPTAFYANAVQWMVDEGITTGTSDGCFSPERALSRGELATFMWRYAGQPAGGNHPFVDVPNGSFHNTAVGWMYRTELTTGTSPTTYSPDRIVTRGELAAFLWRYDGEKSAPAHSFADVLSTDYFNDAVSWMVDREITLGTSPNTFSPFDPLTRGQFATFLYRYEGEPPVVDSGPGICFATGESTVPPPATGGGFSNGTSSYQEAWAFVETFDGDPSSPARPSDQFDYAVTHRTHSRDLETFAGSFPGEHDGSCGAPPSTHTVTTYTNERENDQSIYRCKNHQMTSMGQVEGYSLTSWWPQQEYNFANGGVIELDVNPKNFGARMWWEVMITPRDQTRIAAAAEDLPIDETYPPEHIVYRYRNGQLNLIVNGKACRDRRDWATSGMGNIGDPAETDTKIRRTFRLLVEPSGVPAMEVELDDGTFARLDHGAYGGYSCEVAPTAATFDEGLVVFKHHAYNPDKNPDSGGFYTFHWDNIRFDGPLVGFYDTYRYDDLIYMSANGNVPIGTNETVNINLGSTGPNPVMFGQLHSPQTGMVLVSINGGPNEEITGWDPLEEDCASSRWTTFRHELDPADLNVGNNSIKFTVASPDSCAPSWMWTGYSVKTLEIQVDDPFSPSSRPANSGPATGSKAKAQSQYCVLPSSRESMLK